MPCPFFSIIFRAFPASFAVRSGLRDGSRACLEEKAVKTQNKNRKMPRLHAGFPPALLVLGFLVSASWGRSAHSAAEPPSGKPTLFIVGDSTVKTGTRGQQGWGDPIIAMFDKEKIKVENHAIGGENRRGEQCNEE